jgi:hypothetical protein
MSVPYKLRRSFVVPKSRTPQDDMPVVCATASALSRYFVDTTLAAQQAGDLFGVVGQDDIRAGPSD